MADEKKRRAELFAAALDAKKVPRWGRGASIVKEVACSPASAQAWIRGSLPHDAERLVELCDTYDIDLYEWVTLKSRKNPEVSQANSDVMIEAICYVKEFEEKSGFTFTPTQFAKLLVMYLDESKRESIGDIIDLLVTK
jgi:hypothetical protein